MQVELSDFVTFHSGILAKPDLQADTYYLQSIHFNEFGEFATSAEPYVDSEHANPRHLLKDEDVLFAAKGLNNFAVVYIKEMGKAVASSSFIVIRVKPDRYKELMPAYLAWYLTHDPQIRSFHKQLGTTIPSISIEKLSKLSIHIPTVERQQDIIHLQFLRDREKQLLRSLELNKDQLVKHQLLNAAKQ